MSRHSTVPTIDEHTKRRKSSLRNDPSPSKLIDNLMLLIGERERTKKEFATIFEAA
jgi:hypothetical protein